jgi:hypothetical protein
VVGASRLQVRSRGIAAIIAVFFVAGGVLAMRHEAGTMHVRDVAGGYLHAPTLTGHHAERNSDIHGERNPEADTGDCALLTAFHQSASADIAPRAIAAFVFALRDADTPDGVRCVHWREVYRIAPKTSPPAAA